MEGSVAWYCNVVVISILVWFALKFLNWAWFQPKKMEKFVRKQGLKGTSYKLLFGDIKEMGRMLNEAKSKPIKVTDDMVPRVIPFYHKFFTDHHGTNFFTWLGPRLTVYIVEPALVKEVLAQNYLFQKTRGANPLINLLVTGLAAADTDEWAKHRKIINPAFHVNKLKHMVPAYSTCCSEMINKWEEMLKNESSCEVDVWPSLQALSGDVISRTAFGISFQEGNKVFELQRELAKLVQDILNSVNLPGSGFLPTKRNKRMREIDREVTTLIRGVIEKRIDEMKAGGSSNDDLLGILLESNNREIKQGDKKFGLTIEEVIEECKLFYLAGQETTGSLLVWTMILLAHHKNWQALAREEVLQVFGEKKPDVIGLNHLKTVSMILNEVLRLYPPAQQLRRTIHQDTKLGDITLPAGSSIHLNILLLHYDRVSWGDDAREFNPQRFSEGVSKATNGKAAYMPFGGGPRICVGQNFALMEAKLALAMILQHFYFDLSPSYSHSPRCIVTLQPEYGAHLILHKIKG
uniref:cytochrome P450 CYP72A219-like n=1 Tax=Erigeron canadensis TaxID=72917 RepID=UPI001CB9033D|nr:cytochrome P450 CYP72A219-like [Erigeron canadensis]